MVEKIASDIINKYFKIFINNYEYFKNNKQQFLRGVYIETTQILSTNLVNIIVKKVNEMINNEEFIKDCLQVNKMSR